MFWIPLADYKFIPKNYTGIVIDDLSNEYCDIGGFVIEHKTCVHFRNPSVTECFETPCVNTEAGSSICTDKNSLKVINGAENGTVVSIFCTNTNNKPCKGHALVFNIKICKKNILCPDIYIIVISYSGWCDEEQGECSKILRI